MAASNLIRNSAFSGIKTLNKIKYGHKMTQLIEANKEKSLLKQIDKVRSSSRPGQLLITCSSPVFNHHVGQTYTRFSDKCLASQGWTNRASNGKFFVVNPVAAHPAFSFVGAENTASGFGEAKLSPLLVDLLRRNFHIERPMYIQWLCLNRIHLRDSHHLIMAETGGGKTLAYLLPVLDACVLARLGRMPRLDDRTCQPFAIVLVPTRELAYQVYRVAKKLLSQLDLLGKELADADVAGSSYAEYLNKLREVQVVLDLNKNQLKAKEVAQGVKLDHLESRLAVEGEQEAAPSSSCPVDILITTPNQLEKRIDSDAGSPIFDTTFLRHFVLDETDTLLDDSFSQVTLKCLNELKLNFDLNAGAAVELGTLNEEEKKSQKAPTGWLNDSNASSASAQKAAAPSFKEILVQQEPEIAEFNEFKRSILRRDNSTQLLFVSATIPQHLNAKLQDLINCDASLNVIKTNRSNRLLLHVPQKFIRTSADKRAEMVAEICRKEMSSSVRRTVMIFSHRTNTCVFVSKMLQENGIQNSILTRRSSNEEREDVVAAFFDRRIRVLVCTDIASRGWDTLHVNHVINFEMPLNISEYLHRAGRVGRPNSAKSGGLGGLVTSFVTKPYECELVWNIERSLRLNTELENVDSNIKRLLTSRHAS